MTDTTPDPAKAVGGFVISVAGVAGIHGYALPAAEAVFVKLFLWCLIFLFSALAVSSTIGGIGFVVEGFPKKREGKRD